MKIIEKPKFEARFLLPKYWLTWLGVSLLYLISWLPYKWQLSMGRVLGKLFYKFVPKRAQVARRNLELCFPDKSPSEIEELLRKNMQNTGIAFFETGMAWWWPDWRVRRKLHVHGVEHLQTPLREGRGVLLLLFHFLSLEMHARLHGFIQPAVGLYRPHNNALMEYLQTRGRGRSNKYLIPRTDVRSMMQAIEQGEIAVTFPIRIMVSVALCSRHFLPLRRPAPPQERYCLPPIKNVRYLPPPVFVGLTAVAMMSLFTLNLATSRPGIPSPMLPG